jgi:copper chaperone
MENAVIRVGGMSCQGCAASVTQVLKALDGVSQVSVSLEKAQAEVQFDPARVNVAALREAVQDAGYEAP